MKGGGIGSRSRMTAPAAPTATAAAAAAAVHCCSCTDEHPVRLRDKCWANMQGPKEDRHGEFVLYCRERKRVHLSGAYPTFRVHRLTVEGGRVDIFK